MSDIENHFNIPDLTINNSILLDQDEKKFLSILLSTLDNTSTDKTLKLHLDILLKFLNLNFDEFYKLSKSLLQKVLQVESKNGSVYFVNILTSLEINQSKNYVTLKYSEILCGLNKKIIDLYNDNSIPLLLSLKGKYSWKVYSLLKKLELEKNYYISLEELRNLFSLNTEYKLYADFKRKILLYTQKELEEKTNISFSFTEVKKEKKIIGINIMPHENKNFTATLNAPFDSKNFDGLFY